ncbi:hypothetical protein DPMN_105418 [Dreissena polymorpha]|uniref:Uncharacterized protein n=1 Tax=Dreissena polymorpha TaxID=45954 RepID=A0A9D4H9H1_DREPO|nr:hypothetical protein DPMN_105418 [Dreissena polymorpha]
MENEVAKEFRIGGAMEHSSIRWQSYVDGRCLDDPHIDNTAFKFVKQMIQPRRRKHQVESHKIPVLTTQRMLLIELRNMNVELKRVVFIGILVVLYIVYKWLTKTV